MLVGILLIVPLVAIAIGLIALLLYKPPVNNVAPTWAPPATTQDEAPIHASFELNDLYARPSASHATARHH